MIGLSVTVTVDLTPRHQFSLVSVVDVIVDVMVGAVDVRVVVNVVVTVEVTVVVGAVDV